MPLHSSFKYSPCPFEIIFLGDTLNNLGSVGVLRGHHGCQECSPNHVQDRHPEAPISALAQSPILLFKKRVFSSYVVCQTFTASGPPSLLHAVPRSVLLPALGGGRVLCSGHPEDATESAEESSRHPLWRDGLLPVGKPGLRPPAARWLLCVRSFQLLSISLNGPIQGHSCASETPAAWTQQLRGVLHMRMCPLGLPLGAPDCLAEPGAQECVPRGDLD